MRINMLFDREIEDFWDRVAVDPDGCWMWTGVSLPAGYGFFTRYTRDGSAWRKTTVYAHRFSYQLHHGEIPEGMLVMHTCDSPGCVNPGHLRLGTPQENVDDMADKRRHPDITPKTLEAHVPLYFRLRHGGKRPV